MRPSQTHEALSLYNSGTRVSDIAPLMKITPRQVQQILKPYREPKSGLSNSVENQISQLRAYILFLMRRQGRNFERCELCPATIPVGKYNIHHERYEGATYYDLKIV